MGRYSATWARGIESVVGAGEAGYPCEYATTIEPLFTGRHDVWLQLNAALDSGTVGQSDRRWSTIHLSNAPRGCYPEPWKMPKVSDGFDPEERNTDTMMDSTMMAWCSLLLFVIVLAGAYLGARLARS